MRVTHSGFDGTRPDFDDYSGGWSMVLSGLRQHAEAVEVENPDVQVTSNCDVALEVADLERAVSFYAGTLGFHVRSRGDDFLEIGTGALTL